ncbi:MAG: hypothetical protein WBW04_09430 [Nitrolancea sp.]
MSGSLRLIAAIYIVAYLLLTSCSGSVSSSDKQQAIDAAQQVYQQSKAQGTDFSSGPCIAEQLPTLPDWSADVAHNPRKPIDDQPSNQCQDYRQGKTHHFVELDPDGNLIRAQ